MITHDYRPGLIIEVASADNGSGMLIVVADSWMINGNRIINYWWAADVFDQAFDAACGLSPVDSFGQVVQTACDGLGLVGALPPKAGTLRLSRAISFLNSVNIEPLYEVS